jgi:hypothetical protein
LVGLIDNQWLFNHEILIFKTPARNAYQKLLDKIANDFTEAFSPFSRDALASAFVNTRLKNLIASVKQARTALFNGAEREIGFFLLVLHDSLPLSPERDISCPLL